MTAPDTDAPPALVALETSEAPDAWRDAGFAVTESTTWLGPLRVECLGPAGPTDVALTFDRPHAGGATDLDGIAWNVAPNSPTSPTSLEVAAPAHPNGIDDLDHVVVMSPDLDRVRAAVRSAGLEIRRERPTRLGDTPITQLFVRAGRVLLEIVAPDDTPAGRSGPSIVWGVSPSSTDLDRTVTHFGDRIGRSKPAVQPGRRIATVRHRDLGIGLHLAVMSAR